MEQRRRIGAYGLCRDRDRVLLVRWPPAADRELWHLPGATVRHGEHPATAAARGVARATRLSPTVTSVRAVVADVVRLPEAAVHTDRVIYDIQLPDVATRGPDRVGRAYWVPQDELERLPLLPFTAELLEVPALPLPEERLYRNRPPGRPAARIGRFQRFAAYGLVTDPADRVLLTLIAQGYPGAGRWHLPGGGTDHGEQPTAALLRELVEESGQLGRVTDLLDVTHFRNRRAVGPEGYPIDWHGVRAIYRVMVDLPTEPAVTEAAGGSTARARWFSRAELGALPMTDVTTIALAHLRGRGR